MSDDDAAKRRHAAVEKITRALIEQGLVIEAGWQIYRLHSYPLETPTAELDRGKEAFFTGAQHLFGAIMVGGMEEGEEPTEGDMHRMDQIAGELEEFAKSIMFKYGPTRGQA